MAHTTTHQPPAAPLHRSHLIPPLRHLFLRARRRSAARLIVHSSSQQQTTPCCTRPPVTRLNVPDPTTSPRPALAAPSSRTPPLLPAITHTRNVHTSSHSLSLPRGKPPHLRLPPRLCYPPTSCRQQGSTSRNAAKPPLQTLASWPATTHPLPSPPTPARARLLISPPPSPCRAPSALSRQLSNFPTSRKAGKSKSWQIGTHHQPPRTAHPARVSW